MSFCCSISGETPQEPVISSKTGRVYEKRLLQKYLNDNGREPQSDHGLSDEDIIDVHADPPAVRPRPPTLTSIPALLSTFQNEWDALVLETFTLKQQYQQVRQELSQALYQNDAACRVVARLVKERDEARQALATLQAQAGTVEANSTGGFAAADTSKAMDVDVDEVNIETRSVAATANEDLDPDTEDAYYAKAAETAKILSKSRMKRETPAGLASPEAWKTATQTALVESLHTSTKPGILTLCLDNAGVLALTGGMDNHAEVYSREADQTLATLKGHTKKVTAALWVNGGGLDKPIITASSDKTIRIWAPKPNNTDEGVAVRSMGWTKTHIIKAHSAEIVGLSTHPCGQYFVSAAADGSWAIHSMGGQTIINGTIDSPISQVAFHPDGMFMGVGTADGYAKIVDIKQKQVLAVLDVASAEDFKSVTGLHFSENGYYFATTNSHGVAVWDLRKQKKAHSWTLSDLAQEGEGECPESIVFADARFDNSGKYLALAVDKIHVFKVKGWHTIAVLSGGDCVKTIAWVGENSAEIIAASLDNSLRTFAPVQE
ncbi:putative PRP19-non-snRNP spliceosome component required for DNA repair [Kickxella alabastrina]|uniref:putative PRP19-non-snRNP spliceosome component required for DNA repair n=1 Tax=Kickxella alabastrina TaxID=61397 RepID=UPI00221E75B3|nr:putative PRP19-non-snRNP spliceosome component required for DNA repair [Kickxella alabastrina]KAI7831880.1 putative PRP19-non-snRNP spliceosome component required for DNA repair [Kickxella alabastrina]KAJ1945179.1 hypothetical protein GGF37_001828 [Kickxella alabastrina]